MVLYCPKCGSQISSFEDDSYPVMDNEKMEDQPGYTCLNGHRFIVLEDVEKPYEFVDIPIIREEETTISLSPNQIRAGLENQELKPGTPGTVLSFSLQTGKWSVEKICEHTLPDGTSAYLEKGHDIFGYPVERCTLCGAKY